MNTTRTSSLAIAVCALASAAFAQSITGGTCAASDLSGPYTLTLSGRNLSTAGAFAGSYQAVGTANFDGQGKVTLSGTYNTNLVSNKAFTYAGVYTVASNCAGTVVLTQGSTATFALIDYASGNSFGMTGSDANYVYSGAGGNTIPLCATATLSGGYSFDATGFTLSGTTQTGSGDEAGVAQFDGQGNVKATYVQDLGSTSMSLTATGTYSVASSCLGTATLSDSSGKSNSYSFIVSGAFGQNFNYIASNAGFVRSGAAHSSLTNPSEAIGNVASYVVNSTPPGSVFALFGVNLATKTASALSVPLPTTLLNTSVTVNGTSVPLFYADTGQINAQMPWDVPGNSVATVIVKNGTSISNAVAMYVPATAPGISVYGNNRAVVVDKDNVTVNSPTAPASPGDEVVVFFTGGGPVQPSGKLVTGAASPSGLSPVTSPSSLTVGGATSKVLYMGLTPQGVGLYQANFVVPQLAAGTYPVVITIGGQASNNPVMTVK